MTCHWLTIVYPSFITYPYPLLYAPSPPAPPSCTLLRRPSLTALEANPNCVLVCTETGGHLGEERTYYVWVHVRFLPN